MRKYIFAMVAIVIGFGTLLVAPARGEIDPFRCAAKQMRCESQRFDCLARCDRRASARMSHSAEAGPAEPPSCEQSCEDRYHGKMDRLAANPPCDEPPSRSACEARLLRTAAANELCWSRCARRAASLDGFDGSACDESCTTRCETDADAIMAEPVCQDGRVGTEPICRSVAP